MANSPKSEVMTLRARLAELEQRLGRLAEAEEQILGARAQAQALLDNIPHMAWMKNTQGVFLAVNEAFAQACGHSKGDVLGKTDRDIWPIEHAGKYIQDDLRVIASGQKFFVEERIAEGGGVKWFETFKTPIRDGKGTVVGTVGLARDITDRKRAEAEHQLLERRMQETQKLESLGVLAGGIAHDFNNLLVAVLANAELALQMLARAESQQAILERVADARNAALHAAELTNQMLAYSGRGHFDVRPISLNELVLDMGHLLAASLSKKARVEYDLPGLPAVQADVAQIRQVIMNLITNASDALEDRAGTIHVRTGVELVGSSLPDLYGHAPLVPGSYAFLEVADDGCGMDAETCARLFEPFFTTKFTGRGLGLSAVQGIVRGHGGGIVLRSTLGTGTTIKVLLSCVGDQPPVGAQSAHTETPSVWSGHGIALLVDDDSRVRTVTTLLLRDLGFEVIEAETGRDAIALFERRASEVRFVMLDVTMPDLSGDQVLQELRKLRSNVPVLLCSGYGEEEMRASFSSEDMETFLQKPYPLRALKARLQHLLR